MAASAVLVTLGLAGCSDEPNIEKADLIRQGDQICRDTQQSLQAELDRLRTQDATTTTTLAEGEGEAVEGEDGSVPATEPPRTEVAATEAQLIQQVILPAVRQMFDRIEQLGTPDGDADRLRSIYDRIDDLLDDGAAGASTDFAETYAEILGELREYGFEDCAQSAGS